MSNFETILGLEKENRLLKKKLSDLDEDPFLDSLPFCDNCETIMKPTIFKGRFDTFNCWMCECQNMEKDFLNDIEIFRGNYG